VAVKSGGGAVVEHLGEWGCEVLEIVGRGGGRGRLGQHPVAGVAVARRLPAHGAARRGAQRVILHRSPAAERVALPGDVPRAVVARQDLHILVGLRWVEAPILVVGEACRTPRVHEIRLAPLRINYSGQDAACAIKAKLALIASRLGKDSTAFLVDDV